MSDEIDLSGEQDPTERMVEQQQQAQERAEDDENLRDTGHDGSVETDEFDVSEALSNL
jgi:hypothetical protein